MKRAEELSYRVVKPSEIVELPESMERMILNCLSKDPSGRPDSATELLAAAPFLQRTDVSYDELVVQRRGPGEEHWTKVYGADEASLPESPSYKPKAARASAEPPPSFGPPIKETAGAPITVDPEPVKVELAAPDTSSEMPCLYVVTSGGTLVRHELTGASYSVGRHWSCDIEIDDEGVSRFMGELKAQRDGYVFYDHNSANGTFRNGVKIGEGGTPPLQHGDVMMFGQATATFRNPLGVTPLTFKVRFAQSNVEVITDGVTSLLEGAEDSDVDIDYACRMGSCFSCMTKVLSGKVRTEEGSEIDEDSRRAGYVLTCISYPESDVVLDA